MKIQMFTIYDRKMNLYQTPCYAHNNVSMMRTLSDNLNRSDTLMSRYPVDYDLYHVGEFDDESCKITPLSEKLFVCKLEDLIPEREVKK